MARIAIYTRVSTDRQKHDTQLRELRAWAKWAGHKITEVYSDAGISGSKGRDKRPAFDAMLKAAVRREFDMLAVWSSDRSNISSTSCRPSATPGSGCTSTLRLSTPLRRQGGLCSECWPCSENLSAK